MKKLLLAVSITASLFSCRPNDDRNPVPAYTAKITSVKQLPDSTKLSDATYNSDKTIASQRSYADGKVISTTTYTYTNGQLQKTTVSTSDTSNTTTENVYTNGLLTKTNSLDKGGNIVGYTSYTYNSSNLLIKEEVYTIEEGTATPQDYYTTYNYTGVNLTQVNAVIRNAGSKEGTDSSFAIQKLSYDNNGNVIKLEAPKTDLSLDSETLPSTLDFYTLAEITYDLTHLAPSQDFVTYFLPVSKLLIKTNNLPSSIKTYQANGNVDVNASLIYTFNKRNYPSTVKNTIGGVASATYLITYLE